MGLTYHSGAELARLNENYCPTVGYVTNFLTENHPGRKGSVCPFVASAISSNALVFAIVSENVKARLRACVRIAVAHQGKASNNGARVLLFDPPISHWTLNSLHRKLQLEAMESGCMLGMFGPEMDAPSVHQPDFYPFRAPQNILVVRDMIPHDIHFFRLTGRLWKQSRIRMYEAYLKKFQFASTEAARVGNEIARRELARERSRWF